MKAFIQVGRKFYSVVSQGVTVFIVMCVMFPFFGICQSFSSDFLRNNLRNLQLTKGYKSDWSYAVNMNQVSISDIDSLLADSTKRIELSARNKAAFSIGFLPVTLLQQYNSALPYGWNDAGMIPAKGYQMLALAGVYARIGKHISIQFAPEFVYAANQPYDQFSPQLGERVWASYYRFLNTSDIPEQWGEKPYQKFFAGQSSIRYNFKAFSAGVSTENMWWGPGWKNSLVMSTNAPGFLHFTFNTTRPVVTGIGNFEGQVIGGKLEESGILPPRIYSVDPGGNFLYQPKSTDWRYITGMVLTWEPKWLKHLYLGISKVSYLYNTDITNPLDVLPLQGYFGRVRTEAERTHKKSSMGSLFARYVLPGEQAEIYMEFGRKDISLMPWNLFQAEDYRRAYVAGLRKLFTLKNGAYLQLATEFTQMQAPTAELIMDPDSWYTDRSVRQGYTNMGQVIGAGIGPGSNSQAIEFSWVKGLKRIGLEFERIRYNSDFYYYAFEFVKDFRRHWIDISTTLHADWNIKNILISAQMSVVRSYNYKWLIIQVTPNTPANYFTPGNEFLNFSSRLAVSYRF
jgi:hypothetical protein